MSCCKQMTEELSLNGEGFFLCPDNNKLAITARESKRFILINNCPWCGTMIDPEEVEAFCKDKSNWERKKILQQLLIKANI